MWYIYILQCADNSLYTGVTNNLERRLKEHNAKKGGSYTRSRLPVKLAYSEHQPDKSSALKREHEIKGWNRTKKHLIFTRIEETKHLSFKQNSIPVMQYLIKE